MNKTAILELVNLCTVGRKSFHADTDARDPVPIRLHASRTLGLQSPLQHLAFSDLPYLWDVWEPKPPFATMLGLLEKSKSIWLGDWAWGTQEVVLEADTKCNQSEDGSLPCSSLPCHPDCTCANPTPPHNCLEFYWAFRSSYLHLPSANITGMHHSTQFVWYWALSHQPFKRRSGGMAEWVKVRAAKPDKPSFILGTYLVEENLTDYYMLSSDLYTSTRSQ